MTIKLHRFIHNDIRSTLLRDTAQVGRLRYEMVGLLIVSLNYVNCRHWSQLGCTKYNPDVIILQET